MPNPLRRTRVLDALGQSLGDAEPLLNRREKQYPGIRGHPTAVESHMHGLPFTDGKPDRIPVESSMAGANSVVFG